MAFLKPNFSCHQTKSFILKLVSMIRSWIVFSTPAGYEDA